MAGPDFWTNQERARQQTDELRKLKTTVGPLQKLVNGSEDLQVLMEFAEEDDSGESAAELKATVERLTAEIERVELQVTMSNPADSCAAYLTVQAGEGGTDSADWAQMLLRMYIRWGERRGFKVEEIDICAVKWEIIDSFGSAHLIRPVAGTRHLRQWISCLTSTMK